MKNLLDSMQLKNSCPTIKANINHLAISSSQVQDKSYRRHHEASSVGLFFLPYPCIDRYWRFRIHCWFAVIAVIIMSVGTSSHGDDHSTIEFCCRQRLLQSQLLLSIIIGTSIAMCHIGLVLRGQRIFVLARNIPRPKRVYCHDREPQCG